MSIELAPNGLPQSSQWLFPEYDFARMNSDKYAGVIIERILNRGSWVEIRWLLDTYGKREIARWVRAHGYRVSTNEHSITGATCWESSVMLFHRGRK